MDPIRRKILATGAAATAMAAPVSVEGAQGADSPGGASDTFVPPGASGCVWLDGGVDATGRRTYLVRVV